MSAPTCSFEKRKRRCSAERASKIKLRRNDLYRQLSDEKREMLLSRRRVTNLESSSSSLLLQRANKPSCFGVGVELPRQKALTIREPSSITQKVVNPPCLNNPTVACEKGKNILDHFSILEIGSTSAAAAELHDPTTSLAVKKVVDTTFTNNPTTASKREKNTLGRSSIFEIGSTSTAATKSHDPTTLSVITKETIKSPKITKEAKEVFFERNIIVNDEDLLLHQKLNTNQKIAYDMILERVFSDKAGAFFIDGPGGSGKTFLYCALLATVRSRGFIALATATSGVAASILPGGRTAHSRFKIPINIDEKFSCNISKQSSLASLIHDAKLIVWDEVSMAKKNMIEALDSLLKDIMDSNVLFGEKVVVFGGDFRQTLPVVRGGKKEDFIRESILNSEIWNQLEKLQLTENMRAKTDPSFCEYLMRIGNGKEKLT